MQVGRFALALAIGSAGGGLFSLLTVPLPWMLGPMAVVTIAAILGAPVRIPNFLREATVPVIGVLLGSAFTPALLAQMTQWWLTIGGMLIWIVVVALISLRYYRNVAGYGPVTAFFSATPGGLNEMVFVGRAMGGDDRIIALMHGLRVLIVVFTIPIWYRAQGDFTVAAQDASWVGFDIAIKDGLILAACGVAGTLGARRMGVPAAVLFGPMLLSAIAHLAGLTGAQPPTPLVNIAQLVMGIVVGCRFSGANGRMIARAVIHALPTTGLMLGGAIFTAWLLQKVTDFPLAALVLALSPGGLAEMSLVALALGVDPAFVACHHILRLFAVVTTAPLVFRLIGGSRGDERAD
jgi:uncharacterized protein